MSVPPIEPLPDGENQSAAPQAEWICLSDVAQPAPASISCRVMDFFRCRPPYSIALLLAVTVPVIAVTTHRPAPGGLSRNSILDAVRARASVELAEDFRTDLRHWTGPNGQSESWSIDAAGLGRPGRLALYINSVPLANYRAEFLGSVERKSLGFAYRAMDFD